MFSCFSFEIQRLSFYHDVINVYRSRKFKVSGCYGCGWKMFCSCFPGYDGEVKIDATVLLWGANKFRSLCPNGFKVSLFQGDSVEWAQ